MSGLTHEDLRHLAENMPIAYKRIVLSLLDDIAAAQKEARENMDALVKTTHEGHEMARKAGKARALADALDALLKAEWMVTHDWGGDRDTVMTKAREALAAWNDE